MIINIIFLLAIAAVTLFFWCQGKRASKELSDSKGENPVYISELKTRVYIYYGTSVICFIGVILGIFSILIN